MRMTRIDWILLPILVGVLAGVVVGAFLLAGFLGLGILGLIVGFMAQRIELEKDGAVSNVMTTSLYAQQIKAQETMTRAERAERRAENETLLKWLFIPKVVSAGLIILGFGLFFLFQLELTRLLQAPPDKRCEDADEGERDAEPGDRVLQVVVRQGERGLSAARPTARIGARIRVDQERRDAIEMVGRGDGLRIAGEPLVAGGFVARRERVACFRGPHEAGDRHLAHEAGSRGGGPDRAGRSARSRG